MKDIVVCIPTIGLSPHLTSLMDVLCGAPHVSRVRLAVNSEEVPDLVYEQAIRQSDELLVEFVSIMHTPELTIYQEWNKAVRWARELDAYLLLVTDDVELLPETPLELALALEARPDYGLISADTQGGLRHQPRDVFLTSHQRGNRYEFATWCFMVETTAWQDVDERYRIWYGDDDLIWKVNESGWKVGALRGESVVHHTSTTSHQVPWVGEAARLDGELWASLH